MTRALLHIPPGAHISPRRLIHKTDERGRVQQREFFRRLLCLLLHRRGTTALDSKLDRASAAAEGNVPKRIPLPRSPLLLIFGVFPLIRPCQFFDSSREGASRIRRRPRISFFLLGKRYGEYAGSRNNRKVIHSPILMIDTAKALLCIEYSSKLWPICNFVPTRRLLLMLRKKIPFPVKQERDLHHLQLALDPLSTTRPKI